MDTYHYSLPWCNFWMINVPQKLNSTLICTTSVAVDGGQNRPAGSCFTFCSFSEAIHSNSLIFMLNIGQGCLEAAAELLL